MGFWNVQLCTQTCVTIFWSTKLCLCVLIPIVLLGKKCLFGLDLSSGVYCSLHILRVLVYIPHYELLWFLSIYVFVFLCFVSLFFVYDAFHNFRFFIFHRFFFSLILWGFGMFNYAQRCVSIFLEHETCLCVLIPIVLLGKKCFDGLDLSSGV